MATISPSNVGYENSKGNVTLGTAQSGKGYLWYKGSNPSFASYVAVFKFTESIGSKLGLANLDDWSKIKITSAKLTAQNEGKFSKAKSFNLGIGGNSSVTPDENASSNLNKLKNLTGCSAVITDATPTSDSSTADEGYTHFDVTKFFSMLAQQNKSSYTNFKPSTSTWYLYVICTSSSLGTDQFSFQGTHTFQIEGKLSSPFSVYIDGEWVTAEPKVYNGTKFVDLDTSIYSNGFTSL